MYLKVNLSQCRRDYLAFLKMEKGKALRKKGHEQTIKSTKSFDIIFSINDTSAEKQSSRLHLKSELIQKENFHFLLKNYPQKRSSCFMLVLQAEDFS